MFALPKRTMTADEFLVWAEAQPKEVGKFELWDGEIVVKHGPAGQQQSERARHWQAKGAIGFALHDAIKRSGLPCYTAIDGASVRIADDKLVEPDVLVYCGDPVPPDALEVPNPIIVVEVLSPSTGRFDLGTKLHGYFTLASVHHYLIIDPGKPLLTHHRRAAGDALETRFVRDAVLRLDPPGIEVELGEVLGSGGAEE